jgi:hypothetical protein
MAQFEGLTEGNPSLTLAHEEIGPVCFGHRSFSFRGSWGGAQSFFQLKLSAWVTPLLLNLSLDF